MINILGKLVNGAISYAPKKIIIDGKTIFNPADDLLREQGYKDVEMVGMPDDAPEGKLYVSGWTDSGEAIQQTWTLVDAPPKSKEELAVELAVRQINTIQYGGKLYKTRQENFTFQSQWIPGEGTSAIYTQIVESQAGTQEDPIDVPEDVATNAFTYVTGKYYRWNGVVYKCQRQGEDDGVEHSFNYSPDQLLSQYFVLAE